MDKQLMFFIIHNDMVMRRIIADFTRQLIRDGELPDMVASYELRGGKEALGIFEMLFKTEGEPRGTYRDEPVVPRPGLQRSAIAICDMGVEPMGGLELLRLCGADEVLREISFIMIAHQPDIGMISELGELGVYHILVEPLTLDKFSQTIPLLTLQIHSDEQYHHRDVERLLCRGEYKQALELIEEVGSKYSNLKWTILRGRAYLGLNETRQATSNFTQAEMGAHIASVIALKHLVEVYEAVGDTEKAVSSLSKLTQKSPNNKDRKLKLAQLYTVHNRFQEAKEILEPLAKDKSISTEAKMQIATLLEKGGFFTEAANLQMQMVEGNLDDYVLCNNLAVSLRKQGRYELAEESYLKILAAHPGEAVIWFNRGINLGFWGREKGDTQLLREAMDCLRQALKLDPHLTEASEAIMRLKAEVKSVSRL